MFLKLIAEQQYLELENRVFQLQKETALQRYTSLLNNHPEFVQEIPYNISHHIWALPSAT